MDPVTVAMMVQSVLPLVSSAIGDALASGDKDKAKKLAEDALAQLKNVQLPKYTTPDAEQLGNTELGQIAQDPALRNYQMKALEGLGQEVDLKGMTPEDRLAYQEAEGQAGRQEAGFRGALEQQMAQRGLGGVGAYASALAAQQGTVNRSANQGLQIAADSRKRYLEALNSMGGAASGMRGMEYGQARDKASAQDAINAANAAMRWRAKTYGNDLQGMTYNAAMGKAQGVAAGDNALASYYLGGAKQTKADANAYGGMTGELIGSGEDIYGAYEKKKKAGG